jgi:hypothetical protein
MHGAKHKKRGLLTARGKEIRKKKKKEILQLLEAVWEASQVVVMHCRDHQRGTDYVSRGSHLADQTARRAAEEFLPEVPKQTTKLLLALELPPNPNYIKEEKLLSAKDEKGIKEQGGWWKLLDLRLFVPHTIAAQESSSPAPATCQKLDGQHMAEA